ncbi:MAG: DUF1800 domain-containing protein [Rhodoferax sp.]|jgi:uncharacterized protein (DUF1800 family)|nr:DUF1800 domain-containing protein [Rhodoferax sp.]
MHAAAIASHRFGYSEPNLHAIGSDPRGWVSGQWLQPQGFDSSGLLTGVQAHALGLEVLRKNLQASNQQAAMEAEPARRQLRQTNLAGLQRRWHHMVSTTTPAAERWTQFWANHFCVAATRGTVAALVWPHEYEAIRPHAFGRFADLLRAAVLHPAMLLYLDNAQSIGPRSRLGRRRERGLNENLARELLELHTLGVHGGYTQGDVTETARLLTGWTVRADGSGASFVPALHEPGAKKVLGRSYPEGPDAVDLLLQDLAQHPSCATFLATKLVRHFVTDEPPAALVQAVAARFRASDGDLPATAQALTDHPLAWSPDHPPKFKRPEDLVVSAHRVARLPLMPVEPLAYATQLMGQPMARAPSPQGWPDRTEDWLSPDALLKRVQWAERFAQTQGRVVDARAVSSQALGADLSDNTRQQIERAASGVQALTLWFASPEFQRR